MDAGVLRRVHAAVALGSETSRNLSNSLSAPRDGAERYYSRQITYSATILAGGSSDSINAVGLRFGR